MKRIGLSAFSIVVGSILTLGSAYGADELPSSEECLRLCPGIACPTSCKLDGPQRGSTDRGPGKMPAKQETPIDGKAGPGSDKGSSSTSGGTGDGPSKGRGN